MQSPLTSLVVVIASSPRNSVIGINHRRIKLPEERAPRTGFITSTRDNYPRSFMRKESAGAMFRGNDKHTNTRPPRTVYLIIDELFTGID